MSRKQHEFHYIYKTINIVNGKFYYGMHSTDNLEDDYIGSGQMLWHAIKKYGRENFKQEILKFLPDRSSLKLREKEIVNEDLVRNPICMNLTIGGQGGSDNIDPDKFKKTQSLGGSTVFRLINKRHLEKLKNDPEYKKRYSESMRKSVTEGRAGFTGKHHTEETLEKMRNHKNQSGEKNSQFGTRWIHNIELKINKRISKEVVIPSG
jgi:hypothetical protein